MKIKWGFKLFVLDLPLFAKLLMLKIMYLLTGLAGSKPKIQLHCTVVCCPKNGHMNICIEQEGLPTQIRMAACSEPNFKPNSIFPGSGAVRQRQQDRQMFHQPTTGIFPLSNWHYVIMYLHESSAQNDSQLAYCIFVRWEKIISKLSSWGWSEITIYTPEIWS